MAREGGGIVVQQVTAFQPFRSLLGKGKRTVVDLCFKGLLRIIGKRNPFIIMGFKSHESDRGVNGCSGPIWLFVWAPI